MNERCIGFKEFKDNTNEFVRNMTYGTVMVKTMRAFKRVIIEKDRIV